MRILTLLEHTAELIRIAIASPHPTDKLITEIFRKKKNYGSKERKFISNTLYFYLRNKILIDYSSEYLLKNYGFEKSYLPSVIVAISLSYLKPDYFWDYSPMDILKKLDKSFQLDEFLEKELSINFNDFIENLIQKSVELDNSINSINSLNLNDEELTSLATKYSFPKLILTKILPNFNNFGDLKNFLENSIKPAPIAIRVNTLKISMEKLLEQFNKNNIFPEISQIIPNAIKFNQRVQLTELNEFKNGYFEIQDEGSQLISLFLDPEPNDKILDACAGAGGKSLHIAVLQEDQGEIVANDIEYSRLKELPNRANRSGLKSIKINLTLKNSKYSILKQSFFDKVLVDAPCSGLGIIRRDPLKKYRLTDKILGKLTKNQKSILQHYSEYVAVGGILVYSTCSILNQENTEIVTKFLDENHNFEPVEPYDIIEKYNLQNKLRLVGQNYISIDFGKSSSDGFFMAKFRRIE